MMMGDKMPVVLTSGQKKTIRTTAGTYQIMVMMQSKEALIFPSEIALTVEKGETKNITVQCLC